MASSSPSKYFLSSSRGLISTPYLSIDILLKYPIDTFFSAKPHLNGDIPYSIAIPLLPVNNLPLITRPNPSPVPNVNPTITSLF